MRTDSFEALPQDQRDAVLAAAADTEASQFALLGNRIAENYARMRENGVAIAEPAPASVLAVLKRGAAEPIEAWKRKVPEAAVTIVEEAMHE